MAEAGWFRDPHDPNSEVYFDGQSWTSYRRPVAAPPVVPPVTPPPVTPPRGGVQRAIGWAGVGVGGASAIAFGIFVGLRGDALDRLNVACPARVSCSTSTMSIVSEGKRDAMLVNVFGVTAGVMAAAGVALLLTAPSAPKSNPAASFEVRVTSDGVALRGVF